MNNYILSFCGIHGSGKTTLEILFADEYNLFIPPKQTLFPLRMINYEGLSKYLKNYYDQLNNINLHDKHIITSRFGILDILIYSEALFTANRINRKERSRIISKCEKLITLWPSPKYIINLTADIDVLYKRLINRDIEYNNGIVRDKRKIKHIRNEYYNNIIMNQFSNQAIEYLVMKYKSVGNIITLDSSNKSPIDLFTIIRKQYSLDSLCHEK